MADSQKYYFSSSETEHMIIDLEHSEGLNTDPMIIDLDRSVGDTGNDESSKTDSETAVSGQFLRTKGVNLANARSEDQSELQSGDANLLDNIFHRQKTFENDKHVSSNNKCDRVNMNVDGDNPFDVQEEYSVNSNNDSENDNRLIMAIKGPTDWASQEKRGAKETAAHSVFSSPEQSETGEEAVGGVNEAGAQNITSTTEQREPTEKATCNQDETISQRDSFLERGDITEGEIDVEKQSVSQNDSANVTTSEQIGTDKDGIEVDRTDEQEPVFQNDSLEHRVEASYDQTNSSQHSVSFELSETFLDNLNPQDDSQVLDKEQMKRDGIDDKNELGKAVKDSVGDNSDTEVLEKMTDDIEYCSQYELSETFLDNMNPQDSSQDLQKVAIAENDSELEQVDTSICEAYSPSTRKENAEDGASCVPEDNCENDSSSEQNTSRKEASYQHTRISQYSSLCETSSLLEQEKCAHETYLPYTHHKVDSYLPSNSHTTLHETLSCEYQDKIVSTSMQTGADKAIYPAQVRSSEDDGFVSQEDIQSHGVGTKEKDSDQSVKDASDYSALPVSGQKDDSCNTCNVEDATVGRDFQSYTEKAIPERVCSSPAQKVAVSLSDKESFQAENSTNTEEPSYLIFQRETGEKSDDISIQDTKNSILCCEDNENVHYGSERSVHRLKGEALAIAAEKREEEFSAKEGDNESVREEGEYSSSPSPPTSEPDDSQDGDMSDVLQLSADDMEIRDDDTNNKNRMRSEESCPMEKPANRGLVYQLLPSHKDNKRNTDNSGSGQLTEVNSDAEDSSNQGKCKIKDLNISIVEEDGIDIIETGVDLDDRDYSINAEAASPAVGLYVKQRETGEKSGDEVHPNTLPANVDESDDDVQIIEVPPEPIDMLIVDDDDDNDLVPSSKVSSKPLVSESSRTSKKKRTVEKDGHDLRIVVRDEHHEKEDSTRYYQRRDREQRDERRSHPHRRSEFDRKSSDHSYRRHYRSHSHSRESRHRRSRSHSHERSVRWRHHRERSRDRSADRERLSHRKRRRDHSSERRHQNNSRSHSPKRSREDSWDKENHNNRERTELRRKRLQHQWDERKHRESREEKRSSRKRDDSPPHQSSSQKQRTTWKPNDTFLKNPSNTPSTVSEQSNDDESEGSVEELVQNDKKKDQHLISAEKKKAAPIAVPMPEPWDIPIPKTEDIPIPLLENIPIPEPHPKFIPEPATPVPLVMQPPPFFENPPLPPVPEEEPMENPPEPPPLPPRWPEVAPQKGEGLLPTPIRRKAALEEAAAAAAGVYDPAHPTDDDGERFMFSGVPPNAGPPPPPEMMGGAPLPLLAGPMMSDGTFVVPAPGEGSLLGPPPPRVLPMQPPRFGPHHHPMMMNHVILDHPPFGSGPLPPNQPLGLPPRFHMEIGVPGDVMPPQNQFGQGPPPTGPPPLHQSFPGTLPERFEDGPPGHPVSHFSLSVHTSMPEMPGMAPPLGPPPPDMHMMPHPLPQDIPIADSCGPEKFDETLASLVVAQNLLSALNDCRTHRETAISLPPPEFRVPPPVVELQTRSPMNEFHPPEEGAVDMDPSEDTTEVMDMDMSPLDEDFEQQQPVGAKGPADGEQDKKPRPMVTIDLKAISNALKKLTSVVTDDMPASAMELTNKEKYMKKLHLQERVVDEVKQALRPYYSHKKIDKEEYKTILRKAVPKVCHSKSGDINPQKIQQLVEGYVAKFQKQRQYTEQIVKPPNTAAVPREDKANGECAKPAR